MRVNFVKNLNFNAGYKVLTDKTPSQMAKMYDKEISSRKEQLMQQKEIVEEEIQKFNLIQDELKRISDSKKITLNVMSARANESLRSLPKQDTVVLNTPDVIGDLKDMPFLAYVEGKKSIFSKSAVIPSENFKICYFDDANNEFDPNMVDSWLMVLNGTL